MARFDSVNVVLLQVLWGFVKGEVYFATAKTRREVSRLNDSFVERLYAILPYDWKILFLLN